MAKLQGRSQSFKEITGATLEQRKRLLAKSHLVGFACQLEARIHVTRYTPRGKKQLNHVIEGH